MNKKAPLTTEITVVAEKILDTIGDCMKIAPGELLGTTKAASSAQYLTCRILQSVYGLSLRGSVAAVGVTQSVGTRRESVQRSNICPERIGFVNIEAAWQVAEVLSGCDRATALRGSNDTKCVTCRKIMHRLMQSFFGMSRAEAGAISGQGFKSVVDEHVSDAAAARIADLDMEALVCSSTM